MQFEKEFAIKQFQQMIEEAEREKQRKREEEVKRQADEDYAAEQMKQFAQELDFIYQIKDDAPDLKIEDIIDDIAVDVLELHDSDESGADLELDNLSLDELEDDAIPDDPLV